jgi:3-hydroxybutyryl-CoA dehydrogenase
MAIKREIVIFSFIIFDTIYIFMQISDIKKIVVLGSGTMGAGIAQVCAMSGFRTVLFDIDPAAPRRALERIAANLEEGVRRQKISAEQSQSALARIETTHFFEDLKGEVVIEAIVEDLNIKLEALAQIAAINPPQTILATNTSSIPITRIAARLPHPERVVGMHFFNPATLMRLVEVVAGAATAPEVAQFIGELARYMGKTPVNVQDSPGFIVNRVARHYYVESLQLLEENVASYTDIDDLLEATGFKMGAFKLMDLIGVDVNFSVTQSMFQSFHYAPRFRPSRIQQQKVEAGHHGRKSGRGFYHYTDTLKTLFLIACLGLLAACQPGGSSSSATTATADRDAWSGVWTNQAFVTALEKRDSPYNQYNCTEIYFAPKSDTLWFNSCQLEVGQFGYTRRGKDTLYIADWSKKGVSIVRLGDNALQFIDHNFDDEKTIYVRSEPRYIEAETMPPFEYSYRRRLNAHTIAGKYHITHPTSAANREVMFGEDGALQGLSDFSKYTLWVGGDIASMCTENLISFNNLQIDTLYGWHQRGDTLLLCTLKNQSLPDEKPEYIFDKIAIKMLRESATEIK